MAFYQVSCPLERRKLWDFLRITRHWLWTETNSRRPKTALCPTRVGAYGGQVINGSIAQVCFIVRLLGLQIHPMIIISFPKCVTGIDALSSWQSPLWLFDLWSEVLLQWEWPSEATMTTSSKSKAILHYWRDCQDQKLEGFGVVIHTTCLFGLCRRQMNLWEWQWIRINLTRWQLQLQLLYHNDTTWGIIAWAN